ncbi:MAG TPA: aldehyde dehydrogenase family protein [Solirubrobacterales bacterium]|nr:aldehyde dehydrogenase family protein [Solirubrobacterales bacterium]
MSDTPLRRPLITGSGRVATDDWLPIASRLDGTTVAEVAAASLEDVDRAVRAADAAWPAWAALPPPERARALSAYAALVDSEQTAIADLVHREMGKPLSEAQAEVARAAEVIHHFAGEAERMWVQQMPGPTLGTGSWVRPAPVGVVAAITPWNFPVALVIWKLAPALAAGCAVVVKPAIEAPLAAWALCDLAERAGLPEGLVSCLTGDGPLIGEALATHPQVAKVAFTGSRRVAEQIAGWAAPRLKALSLELGGHGALVVLPDADLDVAAEVAVMQGYVNSGQACYAVNRVLVPSGLAGGLLERMRARISALSLGPMATDRGLARHHMLIEDAHTQGAQVQGGEEIAPGRLSPALVTGAEPGVRLIDEEPFTPIVAVMEVPDTASAIAEANRPDYGLVGYVCGRDMRGALETAQAMRCGTVAINGWRVVVPYAPYAGWRGSGVGCELGRQGLEAFVHWQHLRVLA